MKTLIAIPAMSWVYTDFLQCMLALDKPDAQMIIQKNSLIYDARNNIAAGAIHYGFDRVLWLDSDMYFDADLLNRLNRDMDENGLEYVCGVFTTRSKPVTPCIYKELNYGVDGKKAIPYTDHPKGLFEIAASGFGAVLMKTDILRRVHERFGDPFVPLEKLGEDMSFCWRLSQIGVKMWCDGSIRLGHIGQCVYMEGENV